MEPIVIARAPGHIVLGPDRVASEGYSSADRSPIITVAVNYYAYAILSSAHTEGVHISCARQHAFARCPLGDDLAWGEELALPNAVADLFGVRQGLTVFLSTQAPLGIGLGLSSSLMVSLVKALAFSCGLDLEPMEVAELVSYVRAKTLPLTDDGLDHYTAIGGGLHSVGFANKQVCVEPVRIPPWAWQSLGKQMMLFLPRCSCCPLLDSQERRKPSGLLSPAPAGKGEAPRRTGRRLRSSLEEGDLSRLWELLQESWLEQSQFSNCGHGRLLIQSYSVAREHGALCGQSIAAPGCGSLLLFCPEARQQSVTDALAAMGMQRWPIALADDGVQVMEAVPRTRRTTSVSALEPMRLSTHPQHTR